jgi:4-amino-4-deoxy-L-arabinose transferase-like glycosyltransferase
VVAGSQPGNAWTWGDCSGLSAARAWTRTVAIAWQRAGDWSTLIALYVFAAVCLLAPWPFGAHPAWAYNWEGYTAWRWATYWEPPTGPALEIWVPSDGLMTDSGQGPLVGLPVSLGVAIMGFNVAAMRLPVALLAATAAPLLWLVGRRTIGESAATLAALLLAISPAFLLYARTATLVGVSLVPLLLTALALARVLDAEPGEGWRWRRDGALAGSLLLGIYAYAPVRLLWPLVIVLLGIAAWRDSPRRGVLLRTLVLCMVIVPAALMVLARLTTADQNVVTAAVGYFHARGEQLVAMRDDPAAAELYLRDASSSEEDGWQAALRLVGQNGSDLARLLLDRDTAPVATDYWNEHGRFWPWFLAPFGLIGAVAALLTGRRGRIVTVLPLMLAAGLALPLLLTSRVHVGRLLPVLPFALLLTAAGSWLAAGWLARLIQRREPGVQTRWVVSVLAGAILLATAAAAHAEMTMPLGPPRESAIAVTLAAHATAARERGGAVLVEDPALGDDIERVHAATYRLDLDRVYRFVDLQATPVEAGVDARPALLWRGALDAFRDGTIARPCGRLWFVAPEIMDDFFAAWRKTGCGGVPDSVMLP